MSTLTLTVLRCPEPASTQRRRVQGGSLSLGRHEDCDWQLPDPLRSLSREHCTVEFYGGVWQVRDLSANGTFINAETEPVGNGLARRLRDGDRLQLGDYEIEVRIEETMPTLSGPFGGSGPSPFGAADAPTSIFGSKSPQLQGTDAGMGMGGGFGGARLPGLDDPPPYKPFDPAPAGGSPLDASPFEALPFSSVQSDHAPAGSAAYVPPPVVAHAASPPGAKAIPDNWFNLDVSEMRPRATAPVERPRFEPAPIPEVDAREPLDEVASLPPVRETPPAEFVRQQPAATRHAPVVHVTAPAPATAAASTTASSATEGTASVTPGGAAALALTAFLEGADLPADLVVRASADPEQTLRNAGALLRSTVGGMRSLLIARGAVKREFRIEQTMIRRRENNPLKFSTSDEQALAALLDPRAAALGAVQESISDLNGHQVAVMAATQAAARALLKELEPERLLAEDTGGGFFPGALEKRLWEAYKRRHSKLIEQFEDDLKSAFGTAFARAYEEAVGRGKD